MSLKDDEYSYSVFLALARASSSEGEIFLLPLVNMQKQVTIKFNSFTSMHSSTLIFVGYSVTLEQRRFI